MNSTMLLWIAQRVNILHSPAAAIQTTDRSPRVNLFSAAAACIVRCPTVMVRELCFIPQSLHVARFSQVSLFLTAYVRERNDDQGQPLTALPKGISLIDPALAPRPGLTDVPGEAATHVEAASRFAVEATLPYVSLAAWRA